MADTTITNEMSEEILNEVNANMDRAEARNNQPSTTLTTGLPRAVGTSEVMDTTDSTAGATINDEIPRKNGIPVPKEATHYKMNHCRRGKALIFNFEDYEHLPTRPGSKEDIKSLMKCLKKLNFVTKCYNNLEKGEFKKRIYKVKKEDHTDADCLLIAILAHGNFENFFLQNAKNLEDYHFYTNIYRKFSSKSCPSLAGKPKIFIIQASVPTISEGIVFPEKPGDENNDDVPDVTRNFGYDYGIPNNADLVVAFSSQTGNEEEPSFIQTFSEVFEKDAHKEGEDFESMLTSISREISEKTVITKTQEESEARNSAQGFVVSSLLIRKMSFGNDGPSVQKGIKLEGAAENSIDKQAEIFYKMNRRSRGKALIFNFEKFNPKSKLKFRKGSNKDKSDLIRCLENLDFTVESHDNLGRIKFWEVMDAVQKEDHTDKDCFLLVIMTHGDENEIKLEDGSSVPNWMIWEHFSKSDHPSLAGKPKIFIFQACRGRDTDKGFGYPKHIDENGDGNQDETDNYLCSHVVPPSDTDVFVVFSSPLGQRSWRNPTKGSWLIQSICSVFESHAHEEDLHSLMTIVKRKVALDYVSQNPAEALNKSVQVPALLSSLRGKVQLKPKEIFSVRNCAEGPNDTSGAQVSEDSGVVDTDEMNFLGVELLAN